MVTEQVPRVTAEQKFEEWRAKDYHISNRTFLIVDLRRDSLQYPGYFQQQIQLQRSLGHPSLPILFLRLISSHKQVFYIYTMSAKQRKIKQMRKRKIERIKQGEKEKNSMFFSLLFIVLF